MTFLKILLLSMDLTIGYMPAGHTSLMTPFDKTIVKVYRANFFSSVNVQTRLKGFYIGSMLRLNSNMSKTTKTFSSKGVYADFKTGYIFERNQWSIKCEWYHSCKHPVVVNAVVLHEAWNSSFDELSITFGYTNK